MYEGNWTSPVTGPNSRDSITGGRIIFAGRAAARQRGDAQGALLDEGVRLPRAEPDRVPETLPALEAACRGGRGDHGQAAVQPGAGDPVPVVAVQMG